MAKPAWCPQTVWDKAVKLDREMISLAPDSVEQIARAIMAETEACAAIALNNGSPGHFMNVRRTIADEIKKRNKV